MVDIVMGFLVENTSLEEERCRRRRRRRRRFTAFSTIYTVGVLSAQINPNLDSMVSPDNAESSSSVMKQIRLHLRTKSCTRG